MTTRREDLAGTEIDTGDATRYLELAQEIQREVARVASDDSAGPDALDEIFEGITRRERERLARAAFERLDAAQQWAVLERVFGDAVIADALSAERSLALALAQRRERQSRAAATARSADRLDTLAVPVDEQLTLGLFREPEVRAAIGRGPQATTCARRVVLKATADPGWFHVIEDVFNPEGGYFVTAEYDEETWRTADRLPASARVRPGSITSSGDERVLEPVLHLGGRVDVEIDGDSRDGRLHLGYALLGDFDLFSGSAG